jgi:hypothetical protein
VLLQDHRRLREPVARLQRFLVGDATLATFPANRSPREAVTAALALASLNQLVTQISWVAPRGEER